jgi:hypothetical protein
MVLKATIFMASSGSQNWKISRFGRSDATGLEFLADVLAAHQFHVEFGGLGHHGLGGRVPGHALRQGHLDNGLTDIEHFHVGVLGLGGGQPGKGEREEGSEEFHDRFPMGCDEKGDKGSAYLSSRVEM